MNLVDLGLQGLQLTVSLEVDLVSLGPLVVVVILHLAGFILRVKVSRRHGKMLLIPFETLGRSLLVLLHLGQGFHHGKVRQAVNMPVSGSTGRKKAFKFERRDHVRESPVAVLGHLAGIKHIVTGGHNNGSDL